MPDAVQKVWRPAGITAYRTLRAQVTRCLSGRDPIQGCEVTAMLTLESEVVGPRPTATNPRAQELRDVPYLRLTVLRGDTAVAYAKLPIEELEVGVKGGGTGA